MATYPEIRAYIKSKYGYSVKDCWIAHMKEVCGIPVRMAYNRQDPRRRTHPCPPGKQDAVREAFCHFGML